MDYDEDEESQGGVSKWPFYTAALFILSLVIGFAYLHLTENKTLDQWQITTCILASSLASILVFIPHLIDRFLAIAFDPSNRKDEELHRKTYFDIKEMKSQLEAFSVKIDKVPTLVDKIVSDSQNQSSAEPDPAITQIPDNLDDIKTNLSEKIKGLEELIVQTPLLPEPDPAIAQMAQNIPSIQESIVSLTKQVKEIQNLVESLATDFSKPEKIEKKSHSSSLAEVSKDPEETVESPTEEIIDPTTEKKPVEEAEPELGELKEKSEQTGEKTENEAENRIDEDLKTDELSDPEVENKNDQEIDQEEENELKEPTSDILLEEKAADSSAEIEDDGEKTDEEFTLQEQSTKQKLTPDLPDPAETLRKVDAILKNTDPNEVHKFEPVDDKVKEVTKKTSTGTTSIVANVMIGIGNKPYLRGEGPGLSWEEGVPMNFIEIGKWAWSPTRKNASLTVQLYRNDNDPDKTGKIEVKAGEKVEITPTFA